MPYYDYKCKKCNKIHEVQKGMNEAALPKCPKCGAKMNRVFQAPRIGKSDKDILDTAGKEQSGSCSTCSSGVCSSCKGG